MKAIIFAIIATSLVACGQKGALYLPQQQPSDLPKTEHTEPVISDDPNDF
ncbi:lipoprotein [Moraxella sp. VT-16-12]|nr:lipoprotein [Moraxella sp. VT-16-12]TWV84793.1 lipoprotein [Moraxella sp. VT-16-12]